MSSGGNNGGGGTFPFLYHDINQEVPLNITHVLIHHSVTVIPEHAFDQCRLLQYVEFHEGVQIIEDFAFNCCEQLQWLKNMVGVRHVGICAFHYCTSLQVVVFGNVLETIGKSAFQDCISLMYLQISSVRTLRNCAFNDCLSLVELALPNVETIGKFVFKDCPDLKRIAIPLKADLIPPHDPSDWLRLFNNSNALSRVDLVGGVHDTVSSLFLESWKSDMKDEIGRINQVLPNTRTDDKTDTISLWLQSVTDRMEYYKGEHAILLKEASTLLELAVWKAKLDEEGGDEGNDAEGAEEFRIEKRITSGADIVIKNVLPFLSLA